MPIFDIVPAELCVQNKLPFLLKNIKRLFCRPLHYLVGYFIEQVIYESHLFTTFYSMPFYLNKDNCPDSVIFDNTSPLLSIKSD